MREGGREGGRKGFFRLQRTGAAYRGQALRPPNLLPPKLRPPKLLLTKPDIVIEQSTASSRPDTDISGNAGCGRREDGESAAPAWTRA